MAISTWTELKAAVASWSHRSDLTTIIPDCITLAEARMNDMLVLKNMESDEPLTLTLNQNYVTLPTGFVSPLAFWLVVTSERLPLQMVLPQALPYYSTAAQPSFWAVDATNVRFECPADSAYSAYLRCIKQSNLGASVATNYLLTKRPDVYLAGSMVEVAKYLRNPALLATWEPKFLQACDEVKASDSRNRGTVPLRTDIPAARQRGNILRGD